MEYGLLLVAKRTRYAIFFRLSQVPISCGFLDRDFADLFSMRVAAERGRAVRALAAFAPPRNAPRSTATRSRAIGGSGGDHYFDRVSIFGPSALNVSGGRFLAPASLHRRARPRDRRSPRFSVDHPR